jgi:hypothetical protein
MASTDLKLPISSVSKNITMQVEVTGVRVWKARLWLAIQIFRLGAWVVGVGIRFTGLEQR